MTRKRSESEKTVIGNGLREQLGDDFPASPISAFIDAMQPKKLFEPTKKNQHVETQKTTAEENLENQLQKESLRLTGKPLSQNYH
jgi:hypothetical protein